MAAHTFRYASAACRDTQVAERALYFINNDKLFKLLSTSSATLFPILFPVLLRNSKHHWNHTVHALVFQGLKTLNDVDASLFSECTVKYKVRGCFVVLVSVSSQI